MELQRAMVLDITPSYRTAKQSRTLDHDDRMPEQLPKLRELREDVFFKAEYLYLHNLISLTGRNIRKACELSGLSRSRLYTLLKKYQIAAPIDDFGRQG
jgi:transcriptional regulator of acetoin/glycerol metabolism